MNGANVSWGIEAPLAPTDHPLQRVVPVGYHVLPLQARWAQLALVAKRHAVARSIVLVARGAWLAVCAREWVLPDAVACTPPDVGSVLAKRARVAPLAVGDAVAGKDA